MKKSSKVITVLKIRKPMQQIADIPSPAGSPRLSRGSDDDAFCWFRIADGLMPFCCISCCSLSLSYFNDTISF